MHSLSYRKHGWKIVGFLLILAALIYIPTGRADPLPPGVSADPGRAVRSQTARVGTPVLYTPDPLAAPAKLTPDQQQQVERGLANSHLAGPKLAANTLVANPAAGTATQASTLSGTLVDPQPLAPGDAQTYRNNDYRSDIAAGGGSMSDVMETSAAVGGKYTFHTGNWFAARSSNGGGTITYINPYADMPDFCCDQVTLYDSARDTFLWYRQGIKDANGNNRIILGVSATGASFCNYSITSSAPNAAWAGTWFDYPHLQLGADYLYIATNMFNNSNSWVRTVMLRFPLDALDTCAGFNYNYLAVTDWFTFVPAQGTDHIMWFASNWPSTTPQNNRLRIWRWDEDSTGLLTYDRTVATWNTGGATCGTGGNWLSRSDFRMKTGARYMIQNNNRKDVGRKILGWWWNSAQGGGFTQPFIDGAAFYEDNLTQVTGAQGRPYVWGSVCFAYPSVAADTRGDIAMVLNVGNGTNNSPSLYYALSDDYTAAPPGWAITFVRGSSFNPTRFGDYNTARVYEPSKDTWIGSGHYVDSSNRVAPVFFTFGRSRDYQSWNRWKTK